MTAPSTELLARLRRYAVDTPDRLALREIAGGRTLSWSQLDAAVTDFANILTTGLAPRSRVMLRCPNVCNFHIAFMGALGAGMSIFPVPHDIAHAEFASAGAKTSASAVIDADLSIQEIDGQPSGEPALFLQSSGTTGLPKIARRDAMSLDAVSKNMVESIGITGADHVLACVPLCHSYGLEHGLLSPMFAGAAVHLSQGFDLGSVRREFSDSGITVFPAVPSIYEMLGNVAESAARLPHLRVAYSAGGPLPACVFAKVRETLNVSIGQLYGATEIGSVTFAHPENPHFDPASVGRPMRGVETRIDETGQLLVRAPSMMSGYVHDDSPLTPDGYFPTGDLARFDDQKNIFITGRLKLLIDVGGLKVNPLEVEQAIAEHPDVAACVVVPMRLSETVFRLKAIVTPADERHRPTAEALRRFARERLTAYKIPRVFEVRDSLPRSATGKILRHLLVEST